MSTTPSERASPPDLSQAATTKQIFNGNATDPYTVGARCGERGVLTPLETGDDLMLRRRPIARAAVTTAVVAGTATRVSGGVSQRQERRGR